MLAKLLLPFRIDVRPNARWWVVVCAAIVNAAVLLAMAFGLAYVIHKGWRAV